MITILLRTVIIYLLLVGAMRLMGKRQIGELEISELVTTLLLSEIASLPITNRDIPVVFAVIPIVVLLSLEVFMSMLLIKFPSLKKLLSFGPNIIIEKGVLRQKELKKLRISNDELICALRQNGFTDISEIYYAIIEENGKLTVIPRAESSPPTLSQLKVEANEKGLHHIIISDGKIDAHGISTVGVDRTELVSYLAKRGHAVEEVFLLLCDDEKNYTLILKEEKT